MDAYKADDGHLQLKDQVAVVTGAGRGIGRAISIALADAGAAVAVVARSHTQIGETVDMISRAEGRARAFPLDITDSIAIRQAVPEIEDSLGPITLLVNNAAILGPIGQFAETSLEECWRAMEVNLRGPMLCTHAILAGMISRQRGRIINVASSAIPIAYFSSYTTSKTALIRFAENIAAEVQPLGIQIFSISPGTVRTAMSEYSLNSREGKKWLPWFKKIFDEGLDVPIERPVQLVLTLASGKADALSGRHLSVSDDLDFLLANMRKIEEDRLLSLRVRTLEPSGANSRLDAVRSEAGSSEARVLQVERAITAPIDKVFEAWTTPESVKRWFLHAANVHWCSDPQMDVQVGGHYDWDVVSDKDANDRFHFFGSYRKIEAPHTLTFAWEWKTLPIAGVTLPGETLVTINFESHGNKTKLVLTQAGFPNVASRDAHEKGWQRCLDGIAELLPPRKSSSSKIR